MHVPIFFRPYFSSYKISGIIEDEIESFIYLPLKSLENLTIKNYTQAKVKVSQPKFMEEVRNEIIGKGF